MDRFTAALNAVCPYYTMFRLRFFSACYRVDVTETVGPTVDMSTTSTEVPAPTRRFERRAQEKQEPVDMLTVGAGISGLSGA